MPISVKTAVYEGPLDLLLELIEKRKLLINDISLAAVTDEYIARVNAMQELPVGETAEFVALAATFLLIKSRSLLPALTCQRRGIARHQRARIPSGACIRLLKTSRAGLAARSAEPAAVRRCFA